MRNKHYSTVYQTETLCEHRSRSENSCRRSVITDTKSGGPGWAVVSAAGGVVFSTKAGSKGLLPGHKPVQMQTRPRGRGERQGSEARAKWPFLH